MSDIARGPQRFLAVALDNDDVEYLLAESGCDVAAHSFGDAINFRIVEHVVEDAENMDHFARMIAHRPVR
jgi:hypothetical protein